MEKTIKPNEAFVRRRRLIAGIASIAYVAAIALCAVVIAAVALGWIENLTSAQKTIFYVGFGYSAGLAVICAALHIRNVIFYPYLLVLDEKGLHDYSGFFHGGFVAWSDIEKIEGGSGGKLERAAEYIDDNGSVIRVKLKNRKDFSKGKSLTVKLALFAGGGAVAIRLTFGDCAKSKVRALLDERLEYYAAKPRDGVGV